jgi:hypothetical protein
MWAHFHQRTIERIEKRTQLTQKNRAFEPDGGFSFWN